MIWANARFYSRARSFDCRTLAGEPGVVRQVAWQLARAGTSIAANYEEVAPLLDEADQLVAILTSNMKRLKLSAGAGTIGAVLLFVHWFSQVHIPSDVLRTSNF